MIDSFRQQLFDGAVTGVVLCDGRGRFVAANDTFCEITGYSPAEVPELNCRTVTHPEDFGRVEQVAAKVAAGETQRFALEERYIRKDGDVRWVRVSGSLLPGGDGTALAIIEDVTTLKRAERALEGAISAAQRAEQASRALLAARLHDGAAQMLTALDLSLAALREGRVADSDELSTWPVDLVAQCTREIRLISHLLNMPELERVGLAAAAKEWTRGFAQRSGCAVDLDVDCSIPLSPAAERTVFRLLQDTLAEFYKNSKIGPATVRLQCNGAGALLEVRGAATGAGVNLGVGLSGLQERAELAGGVVEIAASAHGTTLTARIPGSAG